MKVDHNRVYGFMVFNAIFNNISVGYIDGENQSTLRKPPTCLKTLTNFIT